MMLVVAQRDAHVESPKPADMYQVGTVALVHKIVKMPNQNALHLHRRRFPGPRIRMAATGAVSDR